MCNFLFRDVFKMEKELIIPSDYFTKDTRENVIVVRIIEPEMTYSLRHIVLRPNQSIEDSKYDTDHQKDAFHVGAFYQGMLISVASFITERNPDFHIERQYRLRQMATLKEFRKLGAGKAVVSFAENIIKARRFSFPMV